MPLAEQKITIQPDHVVVERPADYEVNLDQQPAELQALAAACKDANCQKVLILGQRTKVSLSTFDILDLGARIAELGLKIAIVELHDGSSDQVGFLETVTSNRGCAMRFFDNEHDAKDWLEIK